MPTPSLEEEGNSLAEVEERWFVMAEHGIWIDLVYRDCRIEVVVDGLIRSKETTTIVRLDNQIDRTGDLWVHILDQPNTDVGKDGFFQQR